MSQRTGIAPLAQPAYHGLVSGPLGRLSYAGIHERMLVTERMRMRYWNTYSLVYVREGVARFEDQDGHALPVGPGDLMLMFPRHGYRYLNDPAVPWTELFVQFEGPVFDLWRKERLLRTGDPVWHLEPVSYWWPKLAAIAAPDARRGPVSALRRVCLLQAFLGEAHEAAHRRESDAAQTVWLAQARALLEENLAAYPDWEALARRMGMPYDRFRKHFQSLSGQAPAQYRALRRIAWAATLLERDASPVKEIARACGYHDAFHFMKRFKAATGLTPAQYRLRGRQSREAGRSHT